MTEIQFHKLESDVSIFTKIVIVNDLKKYIFVLAYVDDLLLVSG